jgi:uncharacterized protein (TIGR03067 family)
MMGSVSVGLLALVLVAPAPTDPARKAAADLQGTWELVSFGEKGQKPGPAETPTILVVKGNELTLRRGTAPARHFTFAVDPARSPVHMDMTPIGEPGICHAIYRLEKGELTICAGSQLNPDDPAGRPREFATARGKADRPPKGSVLFTFRRTEAGPRPRVVPADPLRQTAENLKRIGVAFHDFHEAAGHLPAGTASAPGKPLLSWRVQLLPYLGEGELYKQFKLDEPWDSAHNKKLVEKIPAVYVPVRGKPGAGLTYYQAFAGKRGLLRPGERPRLRDITDGLSPTFMVVEAAEPVVWTRPADLIFDGTDVPALGGMFDGRFHAVMGAGEVHRFRKGADPATLRRLIDPADGGDVDLKGVLEPPGKE